MNNCPPETPEKTATEIEEECRIEQQKQIAKEWDKKEVSIPKGNFLFLLCYQGVGPLILPSFLCLGFFWLWQTYIIYWYIFVLVAPLAFMFIYMFYIVLLTEMSFWLVNNWANRTSPPEEGEFSRNFSGGDVEDIRLRYYHVRGFLFKWPVFFAKKSIFPWLQTYVLNRLGENKIHRNAMYWDSFVGLEMIELGENTIIEDGCVISSHVVDSIYGSLTIKWIRFGKNDICSPNCSAAPGCTIQDNVVVLPNSFLLKAKSYDSENAVFANCPARPYEFEGLESCWNKYKDLSNKKETNK